jgi:hypothetical protein
MTLIIFVIKLQAAFNCEAVARKFLFVVVFSFPFSAGCFVDGELYTNEQLVCEFSTP